MGGWRTSWDELKGIQFPGGGNFCQLPANDEITEAPDDGIELGIDDTPGVA